MIFQDGPYLTKEQAQRYYDALTRADQQWKRVNWNDELRLARRRFKTRAIYACVGLALGCLLALLAGCAPRAKYIPCGDYPNENRRPCLVDICPCEYPWAPWFDPCCSPRGYEKVSR